MHTNMPAGNQQNFAEISSPPLSPSSRIVSLDVLRGIAVLAALLVSIWIFGGFSDEQQKQLILQSKGWNFRGFAAIDLLLNGKMRALIALVFGASMILFLNRKKQAGMKAVGDVSINRQLWLIVVGLINFVVL